MTRYEYQKQQLEARSKHENNIKDLTNQLAEAKKILHTINSLVDPAGDFEKEKEKREVQKEIRRLETLISDEKEAHKSTFEAYPGDVEKVLKTMTLYED